eukprot:EC714932.1.p2 GENE.EC714932.1~~EC714932.1.p2  ORF type:complete len:74 (-),score=4.43 EC714932.1:53-274(-)
MPVHVLIEEGTHDHSRCGEVCIELCEYALMGHTRCQHRETGQGVLEKARECVLCECGRVQTGADLGRTVEHAR